VCCPQTGCTSTGDGGADAADAGDAAQPGPYTCPAGQPVQDCSACPNFPEPCVGCNGNTLNRACALLQDDCKFSFPAGFGYCLCQTALDCKIPTHVCLASSCRTCGEGASNNAPCKNGLKCDKTSGTCH
jgi:hypothetical protein